MKRKNNILINNSLFFKKIILKDINNNIFYIIKLKPFEKTNINILMRDNDIKYLNIGFYDNHKNFIITNTFVLNGYEIEEEKNNLFNYNNLNF